MEQKQLSLSIYGQVQGVGFRFSSQQRATGLGLVGYVRNRPDGAVEILAEGPEAQLKQFIQWCYTGVEFAVVKGIEAKWHQPSGRYDQFTIAD